MPADGAGVCCLTAMQGKYALPVSGRLTWIQLLRCGSMGVRMKLLMVDDEEYVVEGIKRHLDWEKCGVGEIYAASSMKQAQSIMEMVPIDIIISDIVMPKQSGFDFIHWVRDNRYRVQVIFLTSYAEFDYARRAISMNSVDYLLKPIDYEKLADAVCRAVQKAAQARQNEAERKESRLWRQNQSLLRRDFWMELLQGNITGDAFEEERTKRRLPYAGETQFLLLYLTFHDGMNCQGMWDEKTLYFIVENVLSEMLEGVGFLVEAVAPRGKGCSVAVCRRMESGVQTVKTLKEKGVFEQFIRWMGEKLQMDIWCGVGSLGRADALLNSFLLLQDMRDNSLSVWNRVLYQSDFECPETSLQNPNLGVWKALLEEGKEEELLASIETYLEELEEKELVTREILRVFQMDVMQMVYSWLERREIKAHLLFDGKGSENDYQNALKGMRSAKQFSCNLISRAIQYEKYINKTESVAEQIRQYIDVHYKEEIRRDSLGEIVYLNTDYMSRIFKKEMGVSISSYILQKRVEEAKKLLAQSNLPINTVSIYVGYSNFSYFTKMFKENTGYSPLDYRRKFRG